MSKTPPNLADLPCEVQAYVAAQAAELGRKDAEMLGLSLSHATAHQRLKDEMASLDAALSAERTAHARAIQNRDAIIADLRLQLHGHKKHRFGSRSESSAQLALELILEEMEIEQAASVIGRFQSSVFVQRAGPCFCPWSACRHKMRTIENAPNLYLGLLKRQRQIRAYPNRRPCPARDVIPSPIGNGFR